MAQAPSLIDHHGAYLTREDLNRSVAEVLPGIVVDQIQTQVNQLTAGLEERISALETEVARICGQSGDNAQGEATAGQAQGALAVVEPTLRSLQLELEALQARRTQNKLRLEVLEAVLGVNQHTTADLGSVNSVFRQPTE